MASVYILYSPKLNRFYIGSCLNLNERVEEHHAKVFNNSFTAKTNDWELFFHEGNLEQQQARNIEHHIKRMKSQTYIRNLIKYPKIMEKLKQQFC